MNKKLISRRNRIELLVRQPLEFMGILPLSFLSNTNKMFRIRSIAKKTLIIACHDLCCLSSYWSKGRNPKILNEMKDERETDVSQKSVTTEKNC